MAARGIYQACFQGWFQLDVLNIQLPGTRLTKIAGVGRSTTVSIKQYEFGMFHPQLCCHPDDAMVMLICCVNLERAL